MFTNQELLTLWANDTKRREFVKNYKVWDVWFTQPELDLTFYKYEIPGGGRLIAMEYPREPYTSEKHNGSDESVICEKFYLQTGKYFSPYSVSESVIAERLKDIKGTLNKEQKQLRDLHDPCNAERINKMNETLTLTHIGRDSWDRPVYECDGRLYVDVDPRKNSAPEICTKYNGEFDGEPDDHIPNGTEIIFIPHRDIWG